MKTQKVPKSFFIPQNKYEQAGLDLYNLLVENFSNTFFVGGMVRDLFLEKKISDIDITTSALPNQIITLLQTNHLDFDLSAKRFGVIKVNLRDGQVEIATFRKETYTINRFPKITFTKSLKLDSKRRDFTINSLYFQAKHNLLTDPHNAVGDINKRIIRLIGQPEDRLREDPLRIIRAYRFAAELNFTLEPNTKIALTTTLPLVVKLSQAKILSEINKSHSKKVKTYLAKVFRKYLHKKK